MQTVADENGCTMATIVEVRIILLYIPSAIGLDATPKKLERKKKQVTLNYVSGYRVALIGLNR